MFTLKGFKKLLVAVAGVVLVTGSAVSYAGAISTGSWVGFCWSSGGGATAGCQNDATQNSGNDFTFALLTPMELRVTDAFLKGDTFSVYEGLSLLFTTSAVPTDAGGLVSNPDIAFADPTYSHGSILLGTGSHSINIFAGTNPFSAGGSYMGVFTAPIPEPEIYAMLVAGLGLMGWVARRRKVQVVA